MLARIHNGPLLAALLLALSCGKTSNEASTGTSDERAPGTADDDPFGSADDEPMAFQSGQRLDAVFLESDAQVGVFKHFRDTKLDLNCRFMETGEEVLRCLPYGEETERVSEIVYTDAGCTEPP